MKIDHLFFFVLRSSKSTNKAVKREFTLLDRIKQLEEELESCKNREKSNLQIRKDRVSSFKMNII